VEAFKKIAEQQAAFISRGDQSGTHTKEMAIWKHADISPTGHKWYLEILFLDEPTASIDDENTGIIETLLKNLKQNGRTTIIMTTHDSVQARRVGDHLLRLTHGRLIEDINRTDQIEFQESLVL